MYSWLFLVSVNYKLPILVALTLFHLKEKSVDSGSHTETLNNKDVPEK